MIWRDNPQNGSDHFQFVRANNNQGFNPQHANTTNVPVVGSVISIGQNDKFIGGVKNHHDKLLAMGKPDAWEKFIV